ncbi:MAG TPA: ATP-dependent DNA ligase [Acidimicrobiia bacterium]|nr:ATP-dependent DNA ligase [Acidimicrobiia bacterium]
MLLAEVVEVSKAVSGTPARSEKTRILADLLSRIDPEEATAVVSYLVGKPTQPRLGVGYAAISDIDLSPAVTGTLEVSDVDRTLDEVAAASGPGSTGHKAELLEGLFARATTDEQAFLSGLILKNLRQGALEGVMAEAIAEALDVSPQRVRRAAMLEGDLVVVAARALADGPDALRVAGLELFTPVQPMLAKTAGSATAAVEELGRAVVERKLDGLRVQVHRDGDRIAIYSRNLRDITDELPGVVEATAKLEAGSFILDGEGLVLDSDGVPLAFQDTMSRPGSISEVSLRPFFFDVLHLDGEDLVDEPLETRRAVLAEVIPDASRVESLLTSDPAAAESFFADAIAAGFEGVVVKDPEQSYEAGRRGSGWLKVKPTHTLDLVILGAEWGSGRRRGWLSNLHLGARDPERDGFVMLGKTFKGLTDEMLEWQTEAFLAIETSRDRHIVFVEPKIVYEIAFDGVQRSTRYPGGVALRFARVKGWREDKSPADADTIETVRTYLR